MQSKHKDSITLGRIQGILPKSERLTPGQLNHHVHIVGASGYGKTVLLSHIIKQKIEAHQGLLFIDLKSDMDTLQKLTKYAGNCGRLDDLQVFTLTDNNLSLPYNLISEGTATQLRDRIMLSLTWSEEFYKNQSASFLLKLLIGLCHLRDSLGLPFTLGEILKAASNKDYVTELALKVDSNFMRPKVALEECYEFLSVPGNFNSLQGLRTQLESLVLSDFGELISSQGCGAQAAQNSTDSKGLDTEGRSPKGPTKKGISLFEAYTQKKIVFLILDSRRYGETAKTIGKFILQDLKAVSARVDAEIPIEKRNHFVCVIDEFADLASEDFIGFLDRARSSKMSIVVAHQEICDLQRISPEFAGRLMGNTSTLYAFLQKRPESAEMISGIAGTKKVWKTTYQTERMLFMEVNTGKGSQREVEEFNIHPNLIKSLRVGLCVCVKKYPEAKSYLVKVNHGI